MSRHLLVVTTKDLDTDPLFLEGLDRGTRTWLWRVQENGKACKDKVLLIVRCHLLLVGRKFAPGHTESTKPLGTHLLKDVVASNARRFVERSGISFARLLILAGKLENVLRRALGNEKTTVPTFDQHRNSAPLKIERHLIELCPIGALAYAAFEDRRIERAPQAALEVTVEPGQLEHMATIHT